MVDWNKYKLIGIGDFTHGIENIWKYRLTVMNNILKKTNKKLVIYNECLPWHANNIMNDVKLKIYKKYVDRFNHPLMRYGWRIYDSPIYLDFIKFIRKNKKRVKIIGVDSNKINRDKLMATKILNTLKADRINLFFAHNSHIDDRKIMESYEYGTEMHRAGYYLKKKLKNKYLIILSAGYKGGIRFDGVCKDVKCDEMEIFSVPKLKKIELKDLAKKLSKFKEETPTAYNSFIYEYATVMITKDARPNKVNIKNKHLIVFKKLKHLELF